MKRKHILFTLLILCMGSTLTAHAQNTVESIRKAYQSVKENIAMMNDNFPAEGIPPEYYHLRVKQFLPATGGHEENIRMYYGELEPEEEGDPYPPHYLHFATAKYNYAAREYYEEYLYDDKGQVMFIYALTPSVTLSELVPRELRMWFDGKRLLRFNARKLVTPSGHTGDGILQKDTFKDEYTGKTIPEMYSEAVELCRQSAQKYLKLFKSIDNR